MPANTSPIFTKVPNCPISEITAANTARDGSGTLVTAFTAGAEGSLIASIVFRSAQATAAASAARVCRVFITDAAGANPRLFDEVALAAGTPSNTAIGPFGSVSIPNGLVLKAGQLVQVCQSIYGGVADKTHVAIIAGDY